ncbi:hydantoinase B/oxoprolinase family protein [Brevibacterium casei]|uniref:hydantoinase B/oxoprolinase family protein n=2 Tax=Brevibacterium casei TaxID=33889 RepID=UPI0021AE7959|nr:hydantoinase B/oxoprolinase family protein [Brevibacterium casei]MCT1560781.1 hydantoinase B/oxoprolinase family protein [Brevibacterium casei]MCT2207740.1 hydantoinase B/oxoprolinase family protein [Brevibacterium casei]
MTQTTAGRDLDPVTFEVLRRGFDYACERMSQVLQKASFSPIIYDMVDFSNALFDADVELIGQTANCPIHIAAMHYSARASLEEYPKETLSPGDVVVLNDPYLGGTHTPDVTLTTPLFHGETLMGFAVSRAHWTDVGQSLDTHVAGEGLRLPPGKLMSRGQINPELVSIIKNNTRTPQYIDGDIQAQLAALWACRDEIERLTNRYGLDVMREGMREVLDYTQERTRKAIEAIPDGRYEGADYMDSDGYSEEPVNVRVALEIKGDRIHVDMTGSDPQVMGPINSPLANTASAIYYSLKFFLDQNAPANAGLYRQVDFTIPEGTWLNPVWPAPTIGCTTAAASKITAAIWAAFAKAIPDRSIASTYAEGNWFNASVTDPATRETFIFADLPAGGWGGTPFNDGMNVTMDPLGNCQNLPAETAEMLFPLRYNAFEMITDSPGAGKFRGGAGVRLVVEFVGHGQISTMESSRTRAGSPGTNGGGEGRRQKQLRRKADGTVESVGGLSDSGEWLPQMLGGVQFKPGESFVFESGGGGGWGSPLERDPDSVAADVRNDLVTVQSASEVYGVVLDEHLAVDQPATDALRKKLATAVRG